MGFTIGMAMFGAIIFIPLFLQIVYGVSAQSSGLRTIPRRTSRGVPPTSSQIRATPSYPTEASERPSGL